MKGGGRRKVDNILKLWYAPLIATDLGKYFETHGMQVGVGMLSSFEDLENQVFLFVPD